MKFSELNGMKRNYCRNELYLKKKKKTKNRFDNFDRTKRIRIFLLNQRKYRIFLIKKEYN